MALRRIAVHLRDPADAKRVIAALELVAAHTPGLIVGDASEEDIAELRATGLLVQEFGEPPTAPRPLPDAAARRGRVSRPGVTSAPIRPPSRPSAFVVDLAGPLLRAWRQALEVAGIHLTERLTPSSYLARLDADAWAAAQQLDFVRSVDLFQPPLVPAPEPVPLVDMSGDPIVSPAPDIKRGDVGPSGAAITSTASVSGAPTADVYDVQLYSEADLAGVLDWLKSQRITIFGSSSLKVRIAAPPLPTLHRLRGVPGVESIEPFIRPELLNDRAIALLGVDCIRAASAGVSLFGDGELVGVADTGIDADHPDLRDRIQAVITLGRPGDASDPNGHGTHVAASIVGTGVASSGRIRGVAPNASLVVQSLLDHGGGLGGIPLDVGNLLKQAYDLGVRIHNNSWGSRVGSRYASSSLEVDRFVWEHPDLLVVIAAGNAGTALSSRHSGPGSVDWLSLCAPGTSKNSLVVGASRSDRSSGGYADCTYHDIFGLDFPTSGIGGQMISGEPERLAAFSSRGPSDDRRIKPDVVAPGTDILSARSSTAPLSNFWGPGPDDYYAFMGGTSMAAPLVAGCATLVREFYLKVRRHLPSAALLRATLINGAQWLTGADAVADHDRRPNMHQGFGRVALDAALPDPGQGRRLAFLDTWGESDLDQPLQDTGWCAQFTFDVVAGNNTQPVRVCLAYTDPPGRGLQNDVNLAVDFLGPTQRVAMSWIGNADRPLGLRDTDSDNNIEVVRIERPTSGTYRVRILAANLLAAPQAFALVVTGPLASDTLS